MYTETHILLYLIYLDHGIYPFNQFVPTYRFLAKHPFLWRGFYLYGEFLPTKIFTEVWSKVWCYKAFEKVLRKSDADVIVSVHPLCQKIPLTILKDINVERAQSGQLQVPFITVITDLGGAHSTWFDKRADLVYVPSEVCKKLALKHGIIRYIL